MEEKYYCCLLPLCHKMNNTAFGAVGRDDELDISDPDNIHFLCQGCKVLEMGWGDSLQKIEDNGHGYLQIMGYAQYLFDITKEYSEHGQFENDKEDENENISEED